MKNPATSASKPGGSNRTMPIAQDAGLDRAVPGALVVDHDAPVGVDDQVVLDAANGEIAVELHPVVVRRRARREHFDHDDRVRDFHRVEVGRGRTNDKRVRLERRPSGDPNRHAVGKHAAGQSRAAESPAFKQLLRGIFRQSVHGALRRHHDRLAVAQLPAALPPLRPDEEGVDVHFALRRARHAPHPSI